MNSMCAPSIAARMSSIASSAAWRPFSGLLPAPRPLTPSWMVRWAALRRQGLRIGVGADELYAADAAIDHVFDGVAAAAADADHLDLGAQVEFLDFNHFYGHVCFS
jgi:hypothetical protein